MSEFWLGVGKRWCHGPRQDKQEEEVIQGNDGELHIRLHGKSASRWAPLEECEPRI